MTRHVIDQDPRRASGQRAEHFTRLDNDRMPRPQTLQVQKRQSQTDESARLARFLNIERLEGWAGAVRRK